MIREVWLEGHIMTGVSDDGTTVVIAISNDDPATSVYLVEVRARDAIRVAVTLIACAIRVILKGWF